MLPVFFQPLPLGRAREPFSHPDWIFEIKWDGFRAIARIENGRCKLISRNGNEFKSFPSLNTSIPPELRAPSALLDGEIVCLDADGRPNFRDLLFHRGEPRFIAFDLPWCNGENLRYAPLIERKFRLRLIMPRRGERLIYCDHIEGNGEALFRLACERDLEGIVAKRKFDPYLPALAMWQKIRNQNYSQWAGREELFDRERSLALSSNTGATAHWRVSVSASVRLLFAFLADDECNRDLSTVEGLREWATQNAGDAKLLSLELRYQ